MDLFNKSSDGAFTFDISPENRAEWVTIFDSEFYPDYISEREALHKPTLIEFIQLVDQCADSSELLRKIMQNSNPLRTQLCRIFNRYVSPDTSVEMLKRVRKTEENIRNFGDRFRDIVTVRQKLTERGEDDEAIFAILGEYDTRGQKGYDLTDAFFDWFEAKFEELEFTIDGPRRAGSDIILSDIINEYPFRTPTDFVIRHEEKIVCAGFARYDGDRGGSQEDDRTKGNERLTTQILGHRRQESEPELKVLLINDGPGLLLGSMWNDYANIEKINPDRVMVCTLKMLDDRLTPQWLLNS